MGTIDWVVHQTVFKGLLPSCWLKILKAVMCRLVFHNINAIMLPFPSIYV